MSQPLPYNDISFDKIVKLEDILNTSDDSNKGCFVEVDFLYPFKRKEKTKNFPFAPENKTSNLDEFTPYLNENKPITYRQTKKIICDWNDKKNYLTHYRMLKFYVRHEMVLDNVHEIISFRQNIWLENYTLFNTQKRNLESNDSEKYFYKILNNAFHGKTMENVRNRLKVEFHKKNDIEKIIKQQPKITFNRIHISYTIYDSYTFKQNEVMIDEPIYLGFAVLKFNNLSMYETYQDKLQSYFGVNYIQYHFIDTDAFVQSNLSKDFIRDLKNLEDFFDFSNLSGNHDLF